MKCQSLHAVRDLHPHQEMIETAMLEAHRAAHADPFKDAEKETLFALLMIFQIHWNDS